MQKFETISALAMSSVALSGCNASPAQSILPGEWELIETPPQIGDDASKKRKISRHCISPEDAEKPTLRAMIDSPSANHGPEDEAVIRDGRITGFTKEDTPDRDFRNIPFEIEGTFNEKEFSFRTTIHLYIHKITTSFEGRHIGPCNGDHLGSGWRPPRVRY